MLTGGEIIVQIKQAQVELNSAVLENKSIKSSMILGPMDDVTTWTESGVRIAQLGETVKALTFQLGEQTLLERG